MADALSECFDFVLFSFNGLDWVGHEDRLVILRDVRRVLADDGHFCFSSHSLSSLPLRAPRPHLRRLRPARSVAALGASLRMALRLRSENRRIDLQAARARGWVQLHDGVHNFDVLVYYVLPSYQVEQLRSAGFEVLDVYDLRGKTVDPATPGARPWLYCLCRPLPV